MWDYDEVGLRNVLGPKRFNCRLTMLLLKEMVMVIDIKDRVKNVDLQGKIVTAYDAASVD